MNDTPQKKDQSLQRGANAPSVRELKGEARMLAAHASNRGEALSHGQALERVAHARGYRDWNTLRASVDPVGTPWRPGVRVVGTYLGHPVTGVVHDAARHSDGQTRVVVHFDRPIDVAASPSFSALRQRVSARLDPRGVTRETLSSGEPHLRLRPMM